MQLQGNGFILRDWYETDAEALQKHADNTSISNYLFDRFPSPYTLQDARDFIKAKTSEDPQTNFAIAIKGSVVGVIGLDFRTDIYRKSPLIGYWLSQDYWGNGIMPSAIKLLVDYSFKQFDIVRIQAGVLGSNERSMRVLEKTGFTKEGVARNSIIKNGIVLDEHVYALLKNG